MSVAQTTAQADQVTTQDRLTTARRILDRAEAAAGLRTRLGGQVSLAETRQVPASAAASPAPAPLGAGGEVLSAPGAGDAAHSAGDAAAPSAGSAAHSAPLGGGDGEPSAPLGGRDGDHLPVPSALAEFFPSAGLRRGSVVQVGGSSSLLLALLATAQGEGWIALAALPDIGLQAAAAAGLVLPRSLLVPRPGPEAAAVVGALVDGVDVLAIGDCRALGARDRRLLSTRLRSRGAVLLSTAHWPGADVVLRAAEPRTGGLGRGWGRVAAGELTVHGRSRSGLAGRVRVQVGPGGITTVPDGELHPGGGLTASGRQVPATARPAQRPRLQAVS